jgi:ABC-type nitrate/sulfonate/bicarbonate transport system permease component
MTSQSADSRLAEPATHPGLVEAGQTAVPRVRPRPQRKRPWMVRILYNRLFGWFVLALVLEFWQVYADRHPSPNYATVSNIATDWWSSIGSGPLLDATLWTLRTVLAGYLIAVVLAVLVGVLMARVRIIYVLLEPPLELLRPLPISALIPVLILYLGLEAKMEIVVVAVAAFFHVLLNAYSGAASTAPTMMDTARTFRLSWRQTMTEVVLPAAAPSIFVGMRSALAASLVVGVVIGMITGDAGLGHYLMLEQQSFLVVDLFVGAITVAIIGYLLNAIFLLIERRVLHWHFGSLKKND